jgi:hypothetical protein
MDLFSIPAASILLSIVICWALFGIACSMIHEAIVRGKSERGHFMKKYLLQQLADDANDINWGLELYRQAPVALLSRDIHKPTDDIPADTFVSSLMTAVAGSNLVLTKLQALEKLATTPLPQDASPTDRANQAGAVQLLATINAVKDPLLQKFKAATLLLHPSPQVSLFATLLSEAELKAGQVVALAGGNSTPGVEANAYANLLDGLKGWHAALMDRLSLWYTKLTHGRLFWLGLVIAILINVDSLQLFTFFQQNPKARTAVIDYYLSDSAYLQALAKGTDSLPPAKTLSVLHAQEKAFDSLHQATRDTGLNTLLKGLADLPPAKADSVLHKWTRKFDSLELVKVDSNARVLMFGKDSAKRARRDSALHLLMKGLDSLAINQADSVQRQYLAKMQDLIDSTGLPIGYSHSIVHYNIIKNPKLWLLKLLGLLISAFAASKGAPFWFDLLNKFLSIKPKI